MKCYNNNSMQNAHCVTGNAEEYSRLVALVRQGDSGALKSELTDGYLKAPRYVQSTLLIEAVQLILNGGASISARSCENCATVFITAAENGDIDILRQVASRVDRNGINEKTQGRGYTALMYAGERCSIEAIEILLARGARKDLKNARGETAWSLAQKEMAAMYGAKDQKKPDKKGPDYGTIDCGKALELLKP